MTSATDRGLSPSGHEVQVAGAVKRYGAATALAGVDLLIAPGTFLVLLGRSGSGKSTLARALAGVERLDEGEIRLGDALVSAGRRHLPPERRNLAMVFQDYALWPHLTALGNVAYALRRRHLGAVEEARRANDALERVGLVGLAARYPHELSGGEQQRVALARAVVARPGLLIFDEPLSNLDADLRERLRVEIATLTRESGATAVYITHDQSEAFALADMIAVLDRGSLVQLGTPEDIYHRPTNAFVARFTGLAGELPGHVVSVSGGEAIVATGSARIRARCDSTLQPGHDAVVLVRPAATTLTASSNVRDGVLTGTVIDVAYRGRGYDHVIACEAGTLSAVFDTGAHPRGSTVHVALDPERTMAHTNGDRDAPRAVEELTAVTINT
ncbi:MAG TPA: ABC transporter ATP-binding protein [Acidothermaceae bacterium]